METLYYSLHNYNEEFLAFEFIRLWQKNNKGGLTLVSEIERNLDTNFSILDELNFHVEDWEEETTYIFEPTPITLKEYADLVEFDKNIEPKTLQEIQDYVEEHHEVTLWDYPLDELDYCKEEDRNVILVETDFGLRFCEIS